MINVEIKVLEKAKELLSSGQVNRIVGWKMGEFCYDPSPATFESVDSLKDFVYNAFCGSNLSKYLIDITKREGKTAVFLKPCDSYSFNELVKEHRIAREKVYVVAVECQGKLDAEKIYSKGYSELYGAEFVDANTIKVSTDKGDGAINKSEILLVKCMTCKGKKHAVYDEKIVLNDVNEDMQVVTYGVEELESMTEAERFAFWKSELSKCIRCNACRNVCPACSCTKCVFDNPKSGISAKANDDEFEEKLFHVIRAYHVAGRCTDCGECSRVCPQRIPLHLLNRKFIKDINQNYGEFQAGEVAEGKHPLIEFTTGDIEPIDAVKGDK